MIKPPICNAKPAGMIFSFSFDDRRPRETPWKHQVKRVVKWVGLRTTGRIALVQFRVRVTLSAARQEFERTAGSTMVGRVLTLAATIAIAVGPGADAETAARPMYVNLKWRPFARASGP